MTVEAPQPRPERKASAIRSDITIITFEDPRSPIEILKTGEATKQVYVEVPVDKINNDDAIIDTARVASLQASMQGRMGQHSEIVLRAKEVEGDVEYDIIDGFHRTTGKKLAGMPTATANVYYNITDEEMIDARIEATTVKQVQWSRIAEWVSQAWEMTEWSKSGLSAIQAFSLAARNQERSWLAKDELEAIKRWAIDKCQKWDRKPQYVHSILKISDAADPELIKSVRTSKAGRGKIDVLTPARLSAIVDEFPGREFFEVQKEIARVVLREHYSADETAQFVKVVSSRIDENMYVDEIVNIIESTTTTVDFSARIHDEEEEEDENMGSDDERFSYGDSQRHIEMARDLAHIINREGTRQGEITYPEPERREAPHSIQTPAERKPKTRQDLTRWWVKLDTLSEREKLVTKAVFTEELTLGQIKNKYGLSGEDVLRGLVGAIAKYDGAN